MTSEGSAAGRAPPGFTGGRLDRADRLRNDPDALAAALSDRGARVLVLGPGYEPQVTEKGRLAWTSLAAPDPGEDPTTDPAADLVLLGLEGDHPRFARITNEPGGSPFRSPRLLGALGEMPPGEAATYAQARAVLDWHARHRFCANCGAPSAVVRAGWVRRCTSCAAEHFPRTDPVVIMIAEHGGRALLGRQASWPPGRFSALAGFVEPGESVEEAVAREIHEEAGVRVEDVRYVASQPWPFPSQLMIACVATAVDDALTLDKTEIEEAIWVDRAAVRAVLAGGEGPFLAPPPYAIAHTLLNRWVEEA
ncbi:NAD(+) diphosphatase [uncultured Sphingomonas sp.]|uniref:NAD(+) diphosphatase n=1 Tax=uncultured Sphingomonas sp. TaxID=158754 RepID=UPI0035CC27AD